MNRERIIVGIVAFLVVTGALFFAKPSLIHGGGNIEGLLNGGSTIGDLRWHEVALPIPWNMNDQGATNNFNNGNGTSISLSEVRMAVENAFFSWSDISTSKIDFYHQGFTTTTDIGLDGKNIVTFLDPGATGGAPFLAIANATYLTGDLTVNASNRDLNNDGNVDLSPSIYPDGTLLPAGTIIDADISFNSESYDWVDSPVASGSIFDIEAVAVHEAGHFQGLSHSSLTGPSATMVPFVQGTVAGQLDQRVLEDDDIASSSRLYPEPNFLTSFASIEGQVILDDPTPGEGVSVFAVDAHTLKPVVEVFTESTFNAEGNPAGSFKLDGLPPGKYIVGTRYFDGADEISLFLNRYNWTVAYSNVNNGNTSSGDGFGLSFAPRPEFYGAGDNEVDDLSDATVIDVSSGGATASGVDIVVNKDNPTAPPGANQLHMPDDSFKEVLFNSGFAFTFYQTVYSSVYVGSNGYLTFGSGDTDFTESVSDLGGPEPRIAALFDDLNPSSGGTNDEVDVYVRQTSDLLEVTYLGIPEAANAPSNTFVVSLHKNGNIEYCYSFIRSADSIVGISPGGAEPILYDVNFSSQLVGGAGKGEGFYEHFTNLQRPFDLWAGKLTFTPNDIGGYDFSFSPPDNEDVTRITGISPASGPEPGGTSVTVTGVGFTSSPDTTLFFGDNPATDVQVLNSTSLTAVAPEGEGVVDVTLTNSTGTDILNDGYSYNEPPFLASVNPEFGPETGGTEVTLSGSNFASDNGLGTNEGLSVKFGNQFASTVVVTSSTSIVAVSPSGEGVVDVTVENENGLSILNDGFSYTPPPTVTGISPDFGPQQGGTNVTITGEDFLPSNDTTVYFGSTPSGQVDVINSGKIIAVSPAGSGIVNVKVLNNNGFDILEDVFTYLAPPNIVSISPSSGTVAGGTEVMLSGHNFYEEGFSVLFGNNAGVDVDVVSLTLATATTPPGSGTADVVVTNLYGSDRLEDAFNYLPPPQLDSVSPSFGSEAGGTLVTLHGSNFAKAQETVVMFGDSPLLSLQILNDNEIMGLTPPGTGQITVTIENENGNDLLINAFEYGVPPQVACRYGNVNENAGPITDVVFINGSAGNEERVVTLSRDTPITCSVTAPPSMDQAAYVMYIYFGAPALGTEVNLPFNLGTLCYPCPLTGGFPQPVIIANNIGWPRILGRANLPSVSAPEDLFRLAHGTRLPRTLFFQGLMEDITDPGGISATNGIVLTTE